MEGEGETTSTSWLSRAWRGTRDGREFDLQELGVRRSGVAEFDRVFA